VLWIFSTGKLPTSGDWQKSFSEVKVHSPVSRSLFSPPNPRTKISANFADFYRPVIIFLCRWKWNSMLRHTIRAPRLQLFRIKEMPEVVMLPAKLDRLIPLRWSVNLQSWVFPFKYFEYVSKIAENSNPWIPKLLLLIRVKPKSGNSRSCPPQIWIDCIGQWLLFQ